MSLPKVPHLYFDSAALPESERFAQWRRSSSFDVSQPDGAGLGSFFARMDVWTLGDLVLTSGELSALHFSRTAEKALIDGLDHFVLLLMRKGEARGAADGLPVTLNAGDLVIFDLSRPAAFVGTVSDTITVRVPRAAMMARLSPMPKLHGRLLDDPMGHLLCDHLRALIRQLPHIAKDDAGFVASATFGLIASCFQAQSASPTPARSARDENVRMRVKSYIDTHLDAPGLSPADIARDLGISRATLYRAFAAQSGITAYIQERRLEIIHQALVDPADRRGISDLAYHFGFTNYSHFSRVFRARYGYTPRELRAERAVIFRRLAEAVDLHPPVDAYLVWTKRGGEPS
jgi:AraC-like DNA-binding protein